MPINDNILICQAKNALAMNKKMSMQDLVVFPWDTTTPRMILAGQGGHQA
jgi:hypothetical protein